MANLGTRLGLGVGVAGGGFPGGGYDPASVAWFTAVEGAGSSFGPDAATIANNKLAADTLVLGLKADGIWSKLGMFALLAGPNSLAGALIPIIGATPTNNGFLSGDHARATGLLGGGKYLQTTYNNNADPQNDNSAFVHITTGGVDAILGIGAGSEKQRHIYDGYPSTGQMWVSSSGLQAATSSIGVNATGFVGISRTISGSFEFRRAGSQETIAASSDAPTSGNFTIFGRGGANYNGRLSMYGFGRAVDLALLETRIVAYMASLL